MALSTSRTNKTVSFVTEEVFSKHEQHLAELSQHRELTKTTSLDSGSSAASSSTSEPYTIFTTGERRLVVSLISVAGILSASTFSIYFPALVDISKSLSISTELINVSVTAYLVVQGIVPTLMADLSDHQGRRPVYLVAFAIYCGASLGLAFLRNYAALLVLRMVQAAGASVTMTSAYGVISDIASSHERASYVGLTNLCWYAAPALGPVLGGIFVNFQSWRWMFHFLAILSGIVMVIFTIFMPETSRKVVDNGSRVAQGINQSLVAHVRQRRSARERPTSCAVLSPFSSSLQHCQHRHKLRILNPLSCLRLVFRKANFLLLLSNAIFYLQYTCTQTSLAPLLQTHYGFTPLQSGLCYLAYGIPGCIASYVVGKISNHDYTAVARQHNISIDKRSADTMLYFPIEHARLRSVWYYILLASSATVAYGWAVQMHWHLGIVLVTQVLTGISVTGVFTLCNTLMLDWHVDDQDTSPMQALAAINFTQCLLAAGGVALMDVSFKHIDIGWTFSIIGGLCCVTMIPLIIISLKGWNWRKERARKSPN